MYIPRFTEAICVEISEASVLYHLFSDFPEDRHRPTGAGFEGNAYKRKSALWSVISLYPVHIKVVCVGTHTHYRVDKCGSSEQSSTG